MWLISSGTPVIWAIKGTRIETHLCRRTDVHVRSQHCVHSTEQTRVRTWMSVLLGNPAVACPRLAVNHKWGHPGVPFGSPMQGNRIRTTKSTKNTKRRRQCLRRAGIKVQREQANCRSVTRVPNRIEVSRVSPFPLLNSRCDLKDYGCPGLAPAWSSSRYC